MPANTIAWGPYDIPAKAGYTIVFTATVGRGTALLGQTITNTAWFTSANAGAGYDSAGFIAESQTGFFVYMPVVLHLDPTLYQPGPPGNPVIHPARNAFTVPLTTTVFVEYDKALSSSTVSSRTFAVHGMETGLLSKVYHLWGGHIEVEPPHPFHAGELVYVSATTGTLNIVDGSEPLSPLVWQFQIGVGSGNGKGSGVFLDSGQRLGDMSSRVAALGDLDGDGDLDAFIGNTPAYSPNEVWLNDGTGVFKDSGQRLGSFDTRDVALGDLDGDGDLDAVTANRSYGPNKVWLNDGDGYFTDSGQTLSTDGSNIALGDVDGDYDLDIVMFGADNQIWLNDGKGTFHKSSQNLGSGINMAMGDLDNDGDLDIFSVDTTPDSKSIWLNDGTGNFVNNGQHIGGEFVRLGDIDADGDLDAFVRSIYIPAYSEGSSFWLNDGTGHFSEGTAHYHQDPQDVALGDLDGDGDLDMFIGYTASGSGGVPDEVWMNDGAGQFTKSEQAIGNAQSLSVSLGDIDGDGDLDAFIANGISQQGNLVWLNKNQDGLSIAKTANADMILAGQAVTYTLIYANNGPTTATNVIITDQFPSSVLNANVVGSQGTGTLLPGSIYRWEIGDLRSGISDTITITGIISPTLSLGTIFTNTAIISGSIHDDVPENNISRPAVKVSGRVVGVTPPPNSHTAGLTTSLTITLSHPISPSTISTQTFIVHGGFHGHLDGKFSSDGHVFTPSVHFYPGEVIQSAATAGILQGDSLIPYVWQFQTGVYSGTGVFTDTGQRLGDAVSYGVAVGDVDGDGDLDAFVANGGNGYDTIWFNDGTGNFSSSAQLDQRSNSKGVALGDLDGDGDLDAFIVTYGSGNQVWLNDGTGLFTNSGQSLGDFAFSVALGDLDGDGDLDAFISGDGSTSVWLNDGRGYFSDTGQGFGKDVSMDVALGDVDGDGDLDAFVANWEGARDRVWLNDGHGHFVDSGQNFDSWWSRSVALGDVDGDGDLDAFIATDTYSSANHVLLNDGHGYFANSGQSLGSWSSKSVALGDLDGDGDLDAFVANIDYPVGQGNRVWLNNGAGAFLDSAQSLGNAQSWSVALGDLDGDGDLDAFVGNMSDPSLDGAVGNTIWLNRNSSPALAPDLTITKTGRLINSDSPTPQQRVVYTIVYTNRGTIPAQNVLITDVVPGSIEGPVYSAGGGLTPISGTTYSWKIAELAPQSGGFINITGTISASLPTGTIFTNTVIITTSTPEANLTNNTSEMPMVVRSWVSSVKPTPNMHTATITSNLTVTLSNPVVQSSVTSQTFVVHGGFQGLLPGNISFGSIIFHPTATFFPGELVQSALTGDIWAGGAPLFPYVWQFRTAVEKSTGSFTSTGQLFGNSASKAVALGDLDGDRDLDAFVASDYYQPDEIWLNDGTGIFTTSHQSLQLAGSRAVALGDLDSDGDLDAYIANYYSPSEVWLNNGTGVFTNSGQQLDSGSADVALGDVDGDGDLDAFVAIGEWTGNIVRLNNGSGIFVDSGQRLRPATSMAVALGDVDRDGDLDAFIGNGDGEPNQVWLNDGTGFFRDSGQRLGNFDTVEVNLGDVDGDGDLDAFTGNLAQSNILWLNDGTGNFYDSGQRLGNSDSWTVVLNDIDGDGDLDAVVGNKGQSDIVWLNDGKGIFSDSGQRLGGTGSNVVDLGDLDGDGDLDIFAAFEGQLNEVWLNGN
ncbi:DUF11 domain-containing protein [Candidatus Parcubacteria bacterium]|nr:MAG: DUF11 domain-containing protein [Candidatus Parcubacteria bacterium]